MALMGIADFDCKTSKVMRNISIKEIPVSNFENPPQFEDLNDLEKHELTLITAEMAYTMIYRIIQDLPDIEKIVIRYQYGLPKEYDRNSYYPQLDRAKLAILLKGHPYFKERNMNNLDCIRKEIKHIREKALKTMFRMIILGNNP